MSESTSPPEPASEGPEPADGGDGPVRVAPPVTVRVGTGDRGQGTGQGGGDPSGKTPRAGDARAPARRPSITTTIKVTLRRAGLTRSQIWNDGAGSPARLWAYAKSEAWMRGSDNRLLRGLGYTWYAVAVALTVATRAVSRLVELGLSRFTITVVTAAVLAAIWFTWPAGDQPAPPPPAETGEAR